MFMLSPRIHLRSLQALDGLFTLPIGPLQEGLSILVEEDEEEEVARKHRYRELGKKQQAGVCRN